MENSYWQTNLIDVQLQKPYMKELREFIVEQRKKKEIYPAPQNIFRAYNITDYDKIKVVIIGQDPYHNPGAADGLAFSSQLAQIPPSLRIIFQEINDDIYGGTAKESFRHANLTQWADQGVLLINSLLTVEQSHPGEHANIGWEKFTSAALTMLRNHPNPLVFMLWGNYAKALKTNVLDKKHLILEAAHPAAEFHSYNSKQKFLGCKHFSQANKFIADSGRIPINWTVL